MLLIDAIYINNSGGKILLDYLISELEKNNIHAEYLLDSRIKGKHFPINHKRLTYLSANLFSRHKFYYKSKKKFRYVLCFGNLPPSTKMPAKVYTYLQQYLFISTPEQLPFLQKISVRAKTLVFKRFKQNCDFWIVQTEQMRKGLQERHNIVAPSIMVIPFYPPLVNFDTEKRSKNKFIYVSGNAAHKNQRKLINAFIDFYEKHKVGELHLTISTEDLNMCRYLTELNDKGYPIFNHGFIERSILIELYKSCEYSIYPSLTESFGLGIIEAIENGCKIIGADRPYMYAVCDPSLVFDPTSKQAITEAFEIAALKILPQTKQKAFNEIQKLIQLFRNGT
jgi:glycosyltransferase involved in cell wall biosynthesis